MKINKIHDFKMDEVKVTDAYIENALEKELAYLKKFDVDRLVAGFEEVNNIRPRAEKYPGWENTEIRGHSLGHYLTAVSQAVAQTGDPELKEKLDSIVDRLGAAQQTNGYLSAFPEVLFDNVENKKPCWVPWYTMDKIIAGLTAAYVLAGNEKAFKIVSRLADWVYKRTSAWSEETRRTVLAVEYGGMNEALYDLYQVTGKEEHAKAAHSFDEIELFQAIHDGHDILNGKHANTTIPKFLGALYRYIALGCCKEDEFYFESAERFFDLVTADHTYITGGNSEWEHFGEPKILDAERTNCNCETCNTYNMLKLARGLFQLTGDKKYLDFYENTFTNAILSSQNPETGMTMYFQPMATGFFKVYSTPFDSFWCCTGTGMENFTKCNDSIYFKEGDKVYVSQYVSSEFTDKETGFQVLQESRIPMEDVTVFTVKKGSGTLAFRVPDWACDQVTAETGNGVKTAEPSDSYLEAEVSEGSVITLRIPMEVRAKALPDNSCCVGFKYGPVVLSAALGTEDMEESKTGVDVTIATRNISMKDFITVRAKDGGFDSTEQDVEEWIAHVKDHMIRKPGTLEFHLSGTDSDGYIFSPHYRQHKERYGIYWNMVAKDSPALQKHIREGKTTARLNHVLIDSIPLGNDQYELLHKIKGENTGAGTFNGLMLRHAWSEQGWFSYEMNVKQGVCNYLMVKYFSGNVGRTFNIYIDDVLLKEETIEDRIPGDFYDEYYLLPEERIAGKDSVVVKFAVRGDSWVGGIFDKLNIVSDYAKNAALKNLVVSGGVLVEKFDPDVTTYHMKAEKDRITYQAELADTNGLLYEGDILVDDSLERECSIKGGDTIILRVLAEDFQTEKTYTLIVEEGSGHE